MKKRISFRILKKGLEYFWNFKSQISGEWLTKISRIFCYTDWLCDWSLKKLQYLNTVYYVWGTVTVKFNSIPAPYTLKPKVNSVLVWLNPFTFLAIFKLLPLKVQRKKYISYHIIACLKICRSEDVLVKRHNTV